MRIAIIIAISAKKENRHFWTHKASQCSFLQKQQGTGNGKPQNQKNQSSSKRKNDDRFNNERRGRHDSRRSNAENSKYQRRHSDNQNLKWTNRHGQSKKTRQWIVDRNDDKNESESKITQ